MFLEFFGLREQPFGMTPDPAYLYASRTHNEAIEALSFGIAENRGFFALIAEPGMGKTTLLYQLIEKLRDTTRTVLVFQTQCTSREFVEYILQELGVDIKGMGLVAMHGKLNEILFEELLAGKRFVLVVDEAQNLDDSVLETVRMLSNFETHNAKLLQIILSGQPRLAAKLAEPELSQLRQRIAVFSHLEPFTMEETGQYIAHRLKVAGHGGEPIFDADSIGLIARQSDGIPRNINNICYNSLFLAYTRGHRTVTPEIVHEVVARLEIEPLASELLPVADLVADLTPAPVAAATAAAAEVSSPELVPIVAPNSKDPETKTLLTYAAGKNISLPTWPVQLALVAIVLLSATLLVTFLGRSQSKRALAPTNFDHSSDAQGALVPADPPSGTTASYDAAPEDTGNGQVLTVMAGPQQSLKDLTLRYVGHFDDDLSKKIRSLNPDLKDPDHLEAGQLIRIPLPPGAMKKVNDTAEAAAPAKPATSGNLFAKFTAMLRGRR
jgi:type II secretory pathway predicted ATPase ExeA